MRAVSPFAAAARPEPDRDRYGRYLIPDPISGELRAWTRATTFAATLADTFALTRWKLRLAALGLARREDLLAGAASVIDPDSPEGRQRLDHYVDEAMDHAGQEVRANLGTALHAFAQALDLGLEPTIPSPWDRDLAAYQATCQRLGIRISPRYVERVVLVRELGVAGTLDRIVSLEGRLLVADLKTGRDLRPSWVEIAIQLALYAHADYVWDTAEQRHHRMLAVDRSHALVLHLPAGEGRCTPYLVDVAAGWEAAQLCAQARAWRGRRDLARSLEVEAG